MIANDTIGGLSPKPQTKISRVLQRLRSDPRGLNLFEAERIGEHVLRTTIARLRRDGYLITGEWEEVPTRFGAPARVLRYRYVGYREPTEAVAEVDALFK